jgi:hypothetical protein
MPVFNEDATQRIRRAVLKSERESLIGTGHDRGQPSELAFLRLKADPNAHGEALAYMGVWDMTASGGHGAYSADTAQIYTVRDPHLNGIARKGDWVLARTIYCDLGPRWEIIATSNQLLTGLLAADLAYNDSEGVAVLLDSGSLLLHVLPPATLESGKLTVGSRVVVGIVDGVLRVIDPWLPDGENENDILRWSGTKWILMSAPEPTGFWVLTVDEGVMKWTEFKHFEC